jgi:hypothetical protein
MIRYQTEKFNIAYWILAINKVQYRCPPTVEYFGCRDQGRERSKQERRGEEKKETIHIKGKKGEIERSSKKKEENRNIVIVIRSKIEIYVYLHIVASETNNKKRIRILKNMA